MARQTLVPGVGHVTESATRDYVLVGHGHFSDTVSAAGGVVEGTGSADGTSTVAALAVAFVLGVASAAGVGTASASGVGVGTATAQSVGVSTVGGLGGAVVEAVGSSVGLSTVDGQGDFGTAPTEGTGTSVGSSTVDGRGSSLVPVVASATGTGTANGISEGGNFVARDGVATGTSTVDGIGGSFDTGVATSVGVSDVDGVSGGVIVGVIGVSHGTSSVNGTSPPSLIPGNFKPIEQRRVKFPKLPRGVTADQWVDVSTREFDSFFNDMHHYFAGSSFIHGVHTEVLNDDFTLTPETSIIFVMSNGPVTSSPTIAIKSISNVPRVIMIVNTGLFPVTMLDGANTVFGGSNLVLPSGRITLFIYTGMAWVGNAI